MRFRTWLAIVALVVSGLMSSGRVSAQGAPFTGYANGPYGGPGAVAPTGHENCPPGAHDHGSGLGALEAASVPLGGPAGGYPPGAYPPGAYPGPAGMAPNLPPGAYQPWPAVTPFEHGQSQHRWQDGLWVQDNYDGGRKWYSRLAYTSMTPRRVYGSPITLIGDSEIYGTADDGINTASGSVVSNKVFIDDPNPLTARDSLQDRSKLKDVAGFRGVLGFIEPGDHGMEFNTWITPSSNAIYKRGTGDFGLTITDSPASSPLHALGLPNRPVGFDLLFQAEYTSMSAGGGINWLSSDLWATDDASLRIMYGLRYIYIYEEFQFRGVDSGRNTADLRPNRQILDSTVTTNLIGPQVGLDYQFGGQSLTFAGQSKAGVMANFDELKVSGLGIGDPLGNPLYDPNFLFSDEDEGSHLTPLIEQSLRLEMDVFPLIPVLKKSNFLKNSRFHLGYWVVLGWEVSRPHNQIQYLNQPEGGPRLRAHISAQLTQWYTHGWEFGFSSTW